MRRHIVVSIAEQKLDVIDDHAGLIASFDVSTSEKGMGFEEGSCRTPTGKFRICEKIGDGEPIGTIFKARKPVGLWHPGDVCGDDLVLTRILRLDGIDPENLNTLQRFIYIHGTNHEADIGRPAGHGCVRLRNMDMMTLFDMVDVDSLVEILPAAKLPA
ncbi:MAG: L,D-transpeptidase family protein [Luteolibacter sp.]